jgi:hypothetical protein
MGRNLTGDPVVVGQELFSSSATPKATPGERVTDGFGRKFRYVKNGAVALVVGNTIQAPAEIAAHYGMTCAAAAVGATSVTVTPGATAGAANLYANGWLVIDTTPGEGYMYPVDSHLAITASVAFVVNLALPIQVALTSSSKATLVSNPYINVIQAPITTLTGVVVGTAVYPIAANEYGWVQTGGPAAVLTKGTPGPGLAVVVPGSVAGGVVVDGAASATPPIGMMMVTGVDAKILPVLLTID